MEARQNLITLTQGTSYLADNLEALTVSELLNEATRIIQKRVRLLLPFILIFTLPLSIYIAISLSSNFLDFHDLFPAIHGFGHARSLMQTSVQTTAQQMQLGITDVNPLTILAIEIAKLIILTLFAWLHMASISYFVDFIYKGKDNPESKPVQEIFKQLPGAVFRIFITGLICLTLACLPFIVNTSVLNVVFYFSCKQLENATSNNYTAVDVNVP